MGKTSSYNGPKSEATEGEALWRALEKSIQDRSGLIKVIDNAPAVSLILNKEGHVVGVVAKKDGKDIRIQAKEGVILAAGGYEYSAEMRKAFLPGPSVGGFAFPEFGRFRQTKSSQLFDYQRVQSFFKLLSCVHARACL